MVPADSAKLSQGSHAQFDQTQWSLVLAAVGGLSPHGEEALTQLCRIYWYPLYAFIRRRGHSPHEAQDLTQSFFAHVFENDALQSVDRTHGKFRSFLLAALTNFLNNEWHRQRTLKRGGNYELISWNAVTAEEQYRHEPTDDTAPEKVFDRRWAFIVLEQVAAKLKREYDASGKGPVFNTLHPFLSTEPDAGVYVDAAETLNTSENTLRVALHRLRRRFGEILRKEIGQTVSGPREVDDEIRHLFAVLGE